MNQAKWCLAVLANLVAISVGHAETGKVVEGLNEGTINLSETTTWVSKGNAIVSGRVVIFTHGFGFTWQVNGDLKIQQELSIVSFTDQEIIAAGASVPSTPPPGPKGASFNFGPNSEGCGVACPGARGGDGANGTSGQSGLAGRPAGKVIIIVTGAASGTLSIVNRGTDGGPGGRGGDGGPGGDGQQGGRAAPSEVKAFGLTLGCKAGPGSGGNGGNGGAGGPGGNGGRGGDGGDIIVVVAGNSANFHLAYSTTPGAAGPPGAGGTGGQGGRYGFGGRGSQGCEGRETDRRGSDGATGPNGPPGSAGSPGQPGSIALTPDTLSANRL